jgi:PhnB protein
MASFNIYLNFPGNTEEAFNFYKSVLGGEFLTIMRYKDSPGCENMPPDLQDKIMHIALPVGKGNTLMGTDSVEGPGPKLVIGNNLSISVQPESEAEARQLFEGLSAGGAITVPFEKAFWGAHFGMFTDKFGVQWMVNYDENHRQ